MTNKDLKGLTNNTKQKLIKIFSKFIKYGTNYNFNCKNEDLKYRLEDIYRSGVLE